MDTDVVVVAAVVWMVPIGSIIGTETFQISSVLIALKVHNQHLFVLYCCKLMTGFLIPATKHVKVQCLAPCDTNFVNFCFASNSQITPQNELCV